MKHLAVFILLLGIVIITLSIVVSGCTKSSDLQSSTQPTKAWYRIAAIGSDTTHSPYMNARTETTGLIMVEDNTLRAELLTYTPIGNGMGKYVIQITNKTTCQRILRWNWENLNPTSIEPDDTTINTPQSDVIKPNQVKTYIMIALATTGYVSVKAEKSNSDCDNSSTLKLNITSAILPVHFITCETKRDKDHNYDLLVNFTIETPEDANTFEIQESKDGVSFHSIYTFASDKKTKVYSIRIPNTNL